MVKVIGVRFRENGKTYYFDPKELDIPKDCHVVVETAKGVEYGLVVAGVHEVDDRRIIQPLKSVLRVATERDDQQVEKNHEREKEAFRICQEKINERGLDMKLTEAEYAFDNSKILFYFTADGRIDFRELVKDLASAFRTRIELRQIGVRDEARALGGYGVCGRPLCCATYLADFVPVSIKMAKEQNLSLNPTKISGVCGRLMCCLKNEEETYEELNRAMPAVGDIVAGNDGVQGEVFSVNILRQTVKVRVQINDETELRDYTAEQLSMVRRKKGKKGGSTMKDFDSAELEKLEAEERQEKGQNSERSAKNDGQGKKEHHQSRDENRHSREENRKNRDENRQNRDENRRNGEENRQNRDENRRNGEENRQNRDENRRNGEENRQNRDENRRNHEENRSGHDGKNRDNRSKKHFPESGEASQNGNEGVDATQNQHKDHGKNGNYNRNRHRNHYNRNRKPNAEGSHSDRSSSNGNS